jgi:hypothetical protein
MSRILEVAKKPDLWPAEERWDAKVAAAGFCATANKLGELLLGMSTVGFVYSQPLT